MDKNNEGYFVRWFAKQDDTIWQQFYHEEPVQIDETSAEEPKKMDEVWKEEEPSKPEKPAPIQLTCKRCGNIWTQRGKKKPVQCPKCKSPYWDRARKR